MEVNIEISSPTSAKMYVYLSGPRHTYTLCLSLSLDLSYLSTESVKPREQSPAKLTKSSTLTNLSQNYNYVIVLTGGPALCQIDADWILEDNAFVQGSQVTFTPFPRFSDVWFEGAYATTANGSQIGIDGAEALYLQSWCTASEYDDNDFWMSSTN